MSGGGFDDNPFADPKDLADNPFADPSIQNATSGGQGDKTAAGNLDDFNPFEGQKTTSGGGNNTGSNNAGSGNPAVMNPSDDPPPYTPTGAQTANTTQGQPQITTADFQRRQEELEQRARELERREAELRNTPYNARANNWPPIPAFIPFAPCFYQDINVDIPVEFQKIVRYLYYLWLAHVSLLIANMLVGLIYLFAGGDIGITFGLALIYFIIFTPASFLCWFRPVYKAFRDDSSVNFMVFFFVFFFQFLVTIMNALGILKTGNCGLVLGIQTINAGESGGLIFTGILMLVVSLGFGVVAIADFFLLVRVHKLYRSSGASMAKAQAEFTTGVMKNETVRQAASEAAAAGARNAFSQATGANANAGGGGNPAAGGTRY